MGNSGLNSIRQSEDTRKLDKSPVPVDSRGESCRHGNLTNYSQKKIFGRKKLPFLATAKENLTRSRSGSHSLNNVSSASSLSVERPFSVPVITVTALNEAKMFKPTPLLTQNGGQQTCESSSTNRAQRQLGLTGVPRHKPIQCLPQTPSTKPMKTNPQRSELKLSRSRHKANSELSVTSKQLKYSPLRTASVFPTRQSNFKFTQHRTPTKEHHNFAKPIIRKRASSACALLQQTSSVNTIRKTVSRGAPRKPSRPPQSRLEYTFYIRDTAEHRRPFIENTADTIARGCQCTIELIQPGKGFPPVFYKGVCVCPVTITTTNMANLRRCLARLDARYPGFNAKAFMPC